ncbi:MAG: hypothetical protein AAFW75_20410 [Cyanobacteria bacterium J06636_16]
MKQRRKFQQIALEFPVLVQFISFRKHHKNSRFIIHRTDPRGFTDEEILLMGHLARYHCKAAPTLKHKKFKRLSKSHRQLVCILSGILRIAVCLDKTKNQRVEAITCQLAEAVLDIRVVGPHTLNLEIWAAQQNAEVLAKALKRTVRVHRPEKSSSVEKSAS